MKNVITVGDWSFFGVCCFCGPLFESFLFRSVDCELFMGGIVAVGRSFFVSVECNLARFWSCELETGGRRLVSD